MGAEEVQFLQMDRSSITLLSSVLGNVRKATEEVLVQQNVSKDRQKGSVESCTRGGLSLLIVILNGFTRYHFGKGQIHYSQFYRQEEQFPKLLLVEC